ncbi:MAG: phytanoyl-CoA dioxygenase family protein [Myxococcales bacterium]|nr:phytanoyl-CoA dioxygenase family protein [Myxococcales bacterium]
MTDAAEKGRIVQQMLVDPALPAAVIDQLFDKAIAAPYWAAFESNAPLPPESPLSDDEVEHAIEHWKREGYFATRRVIDPAKCEALRGVLERVLADGWPVVFAFAVESVWAATQSPSLVRVLEGVLGPGYRQRHQIFAHWISPVAGAAGWAPHVDGAGKTDRVSAWLPLSDATPENGCMMLIPKSRMPTDLIGMGYHARKSFTAGETLRLLHAARAMPATAGSLLGWDHDVLHWGSHCDGGGRPRVALALEFESASWSGTRDEPLFDPLVVPPFPDRLRAIAKAVLTYSGFVPMLRRYRDLAERLLDIDPPPSEV